MSETKLLPLILAERIVDLLNDSGASEAEKLVAVAVVKALIPILPGSVCAAHTESEVQ